MSLEVNKHYEGLFKHPCTPIKWMTWQSEHICLPVAFCQGNLHQNACFTTIAIVTF